MFGSAHGGGGNPGLMAAGYPRVVVLEGIESLDAILQDTLFDLCTTGWFSRPGGGPRVLGHQQFVAVSYARLDHLVAKGEFHTGLWTTLSESHVRIPGVHERLDDLGAVLRRLAESLAPEPTIRIRFGRDAIGLLRHYPWSGDAGEVRALVTRLSVQWPGQTISAARLPPRIAEIARSREPRQWVSDGDGERDERDQLPDGFELPAYLERKEVSLIRLALHQSGGVVSKAARRLGIRRTTLVEKMRKYGMTNQGAPSGPFQSPQTG